MENEDHSQSDGHSGGQVPRDEAERLAGYEWSEFERDLETLGRQLSELGVHTAVMGDQLVQSLQAQYQQVKTGANAWTRATERQVDEISNSAWRQGAEAQGAYSDMRERSKAAAHDIWERSGRVMWATALSELGQSCAPPSARPRAGLSPRNHLRLIDLPTSAESPISGGGGADNSVSTGEQRLSFTARFRTSLLIKTPGRR
jgi:hypothetical protein